CHVASADTYWYGNVNIINNGSLIFDEVPDQEIHFWAQNIVVENTGSLIAGSSTQPYGSKGNKSGQLTIHLYGAEAANPVNGAGVLCQSDTKGGTVGPCGIDLSIWNSNKINTAIPNPPSCSKKTFSNGVSDCFYQYGPLPYDDGVPQGYFGYKVLAVSY